MSIELLAVIVTLTVGILGLFTKVRQDGDSERLNVIGWILCFLLIVSSVIGYKVTNDKERDLQAFQSQVNHLTEELNRQTETAIKIENEREALEKALEQAQSVVKGSNLPARIDAVLGNGEWVGDTVTLKLYEAVPEHAITQGFSGSRFNGKDAVFQVSVVNVNPEDMKKITFGGIYYVGAFFNSRCGPFVHGQEITISSHTDTDGTYAVGINDSDADRTNLSVLLKSNPDAGIQLKLVRTIDATN
jgi:hypothetical protein